MKNTRLIASIAAGAAVVAGAAVIISRNRANQKNRARLEEAKSYYKHRLEQLQHKAEKEFSKTASDAGEVVNAAKKRAEKWVNHAANA